MRTKLFLSHANPEDNNFGIWLCSRLSAIGYDVWIDKNNLLGGEKFWEEIDQTIRNDANKFLLVYSRHICYPSQIGRLKDGIYKEYSLADGIGKQEKLKDFIQLLNVDGSPPNLFIGADRLNQIPFYNNWADGMRQLIEKLQKDNVPKSTVAFENEFCDWYENKYITQNGIVPKNEFYYTSYWPVEESPTHFYISQFESEKQATRIYYSSDVIYPIAKISNVLISFSSELPLAIHSDLRPLVKRAARFEIKIAELLKGRESDSFPTHRDASNHLKALLDVVLHTLMRSRRLSWYLLANGKPAYYFTTKSPFHGKIVFNLPLSGKKKKKLLTGNYLSLGRWHYAISAQPILTPVLGYSVKSHILFTTDGFIPWRDKEKMHSHRRTKGRRMFNEEWRDLFLAFLSGLKSEEGHVWIPLTDELSLTLQPSPLCLEADFGYIDPRANRFNVLLQEEHRSLESENNNE